MQRVLVAAPVYEGKAYALNRWVAAYHAFAYPAKGAFMVDNTPGTLVFAQRVRSKGIPCDHVEPMPRFWDMMELCWRRIVRYAHDEGFDLILSLEADVIGPPETIWVMVDALGDAESAAHGVPYRESQQSRCWALGCTIMRTALLYDARLYWSDHFEAVASRGSRTLQLDDLLELQHLYDPAEPTWRGSGEGM